MVRRLFGGTHARRFPLVDRLYWLTYRFGSTPSAEAVTADFRDLQISGPAWDQTIVPAVVAGYYEEFELDLFSRIAAISHGIVDMGANIGIYSCVAAAIAPAGAQVLAFEPVPENLRFLHRNAAANGLSTRIHVEAVAVGDRVGELLLHLSDRQSGTHSAAAVGEPSSRGSITVPMVSLDEYLERRHDAPAPDLMKIDVEGYDGHALRGVRATLARHRPAVFVEFQPAQLAGCGFSTGEFLDLLTAHGPRLFLIDHLHRRLIPCDAESLSALMDADPSRRLYCTDLLAVTRPEHLAALSTWLPENAEQRDRR
ncbi:FkbM family methyltransferase [Sphaerisporangium perillae]|uniref:FkbM family methyltransferase n=1 Tax=Sphaerisporangium perillae TaxID=2935860 RepID=UPI00200FC8A5|nr:FkbM family methyltransferase [Sphaerisporangium perillae]